MDHDVQSLSTQSLEQGTSHGTGSGAGEEEQRFLPTSSPEVNKKSKIIIIKMYTVLLSRQQKGYDEEILKLPS